MPEMGVNLMLSDLQDIISRLPFLSAEELDKLHHRIKALQGSSESVVNKVNGTLDADMVVNTICSVLNAHGIDCAKYVIRKEGQIGKIKLVLEFIGKAVKKRIEQENLLSIALDLLWQDMNNQRIPTTGNTMLRNLHLIPAVINRHFPGYAKAGLLKLIVGERN